MASLQELVVEVRRLRKEYGVPEGQRVVVHVGGGDGGLDEAVRGQEAALERLARVGSLVRDGASHGIGAHAVLTGGAEVFLPLEGVIDLERERTRLSGELARLHQRAQGLAAKLANADFVKRAPPEIVTSEREKAAALEEQAAKLREKLAALLGEGA